MAHLLGIDLGTTTTIVARIDASGAPEVVRDWDGQEVTPTAVAFESAAAVVIGREARAMADDADHVFTEFKRDMGTGVSHPAFGRRVTPLDLSACSRTLRSMSAERSSGVTLRPKAGWETPVPMSRLNS
ncbi:MAG: Hsp70 family protein, partial [Verrucomicrobiota bacterium]